MKRIVCMLVLAAMVLTMIPAAVFAAEERTVYLDPANGADTNSGLETAQPVKTLEAAYAALAGADEGRIVLQSTLTLAAETTFPSCAIPVTITGAGITTGNHIFFSGDTTLEHITLTLTAENNTRYLSSEGHDLTIGEGVVCKNSASYRFCLTTRYGEGSVDGATLTVRSGSWRNIFAAGYNKATTGDVTLIVTGGNVNNLLGPTYSGNVTGNVTMHVSGVTGGVFCVAPNQTGILTGNVELTLGHGISGKVRVKRLFQNARVNGTATIIIDGDCSGLTEINHNGTDAGSITKTRLLLKSGALDVKPCDFDEVALEIPQGKTMTLKGCAITANTVNSQGTLQFSGAASLAALSVTGSLSCDILDTPRESHSYVTAPAGSAVTFPEITNVKEFSGIWQLDGDFNTAAFKGLVLTTTADGITVELYNGFSTDSSKLMTPVYTEGRDRYYATQSGGSYYCISKPASGKGRYTIHKTIYITEEESGQKLVMDVTPGVRSTSGWDTPNAVNDFTDEVLEKAFPSDASLWPQYSEIFTTPAFQSGRNDHMQTTQTELENFLAQLDDPDDNIYVYTIGQTAMKSFNVPLVIVTSVDLSGAKTLEEAAALIREDGEKNQKLTVHYQAQIHGNEPASGEAALGMIKRLDGDYGKTLLDSMNIYVIPRLNPYGAYKSERNTGIDSGTSVDPNRDFLRLRTSEAQMRMQAYNLFEPDVVFDNHEYQFALTNTSITKRDMMLCTHFLPTSTQAFKDTAVELAYAAFNQLEQDNLSYSWYSSTADNYSLGSMGGNTGSSNTALRGTFHVLMETLGSNFGTNMYERRVASHASSVTGVLNYLNTHAAQVKAAVKAERDATVENGKTYREDDVIMLQTERNDYAQYHIDGKKVNLRTGVETDYTFRALVTDTITRSRTAPTAYVIGADESFTATVLALMDKQGISYSYLPANSVLMLQQYTGTETAATLTDEKPVSFPQGAYVFTMNQVDALILAYLMEPDVDLAADNKGTLVQQGIITATDGVFPIYRYVRDLNDQGTVDPEKTAIPGDMDGNGEKNTEDAVYLLLNVLFGEGQYPIDSAADRDLNNDGKTDTEDAVYLLLNVLFGENQYPI